MRIAYVAKMFPRISETFIVNEILELQRNGLDVRVVSLLAPTARELWPKARELANASFVLPEMTLRAAGPAVVASQLRLLRRRPGAYLRCVGQVARRFRRSSWKRFFQAGLLVDFCEKEGIDHVHAAFAHAPATVAMWTRRLQGPEFSVSTHAKDLYLSDPASLKKKIDEARFVWTCTEANGTHLRGLGSGTPVEVGYHGTEIERFGRVEQLRRDRPTVGTVPRLLSLCRLVPKKGLIHLIDALGILRDRGRLQLRLTIAGDGPERDRLESRVQELGLDDVVDFPGSLLPNEVDAAYADTDLFVLPCVVLDNGDRDGVPNVLVEAMASGVPIISTRVSGIPELVESGRCGTLVEPKDPTALADAIEFALDNPQDLARFAVEARKRVCQYFDLRKNSSRLVERLRRASAVRTALYVTADQGVPVRGHKGASAHVRQIATELSAQGVHVRVLTPNPGPEPPAGNAFPNPIERVQTSPVWDRVLKRLPKNSLRWSVVKEARRIFHNLHLARALGRQATPDFVYERYSLCSVAAGLFSRRRGVPWILEVNAPLAAEEAEFRGLRWERLTRFFEKWCLTRADHVFVVSHALRRWAIGIGTHPDRVSVLSNGVDRNRFRPGVDGTAARTELGFEESAVVVGFAGSLKPWHGGDVLLKAFALAHESCPNLRLLFVGDGPEAKPLRKWARRHGLADVVTFTGAVPHERVPALLAASDILTAPYLDRDDFYFSPLKVVEYLAAGRPVVASQIGEIGEWVDETCGRLVSAGRVKPLASALAELAADADLRASLGAAARLRTKGEDWSDKAGEVVQKAEHIRGVEPQRLPERVGYVLKMFPRFSETFVLREVVELERQGIEVETFSLKIPSGPRQADVGRVHALQTVLGDPGRWPGARMIRIHFGCFRRRPRAYISALRFAVTRGDFKAVKKFYQAGVIADQCARHRIGHLHAHFASGPTRVAKMASMISGVPFSFTAHAKDLYWAGHRHGSSKKLKKRVQLARFVVVISEENQRFIEKQGFRVKPGRVRPLYIGLRMDEYAFTKPSDRPRSPRPLILAVGRLIEKKGFHVLIEALRRVREQGGHFRCVIAGEGPEEASLREQIEKAGLQGWVRLLGPVPLTRLRDRYYSRARMLVQPCVVAGDGDRDGIPTVLLEAMALGVPVVSTRVSGIPEAITDGENGFLTAADDVDDLASRIEKLLADDLLCDRLARGGRLRAETQFDLETNVGALAKLFRRSLAGWPGRTEWVRLQEIAKSGEGSGSEISEPVPTDASGARLHLPPVAETTPAEVGST